MTKAMINSMTGFGRCENHQGSRKFTVEMKAVNHRYFDVSIKMPKKLSFFEAAILRFPRKIRKGNARSENVITAESMIIPIILASFIFMLSFLIFPHKQ